MFFARLAGLSGAEANASADEFLGLVGLTDRGGDRASKYSGGMKRRLNFAISLVARPDLVLLDEPTVGVDPQSRNHIFETVGALNEQGMTVIYTTHYMEEADRLCDRILIMDRGRVVTEARRRNSRRLWAIRRRRPWKTFSCILRAVRCASNTGLPQCISIWRISRLSGTSGIRAPSGFHLLCRLRCWRSCLGRLAATRRLTARLRLSTSTRHLSRPGLIELISAVPGLDVEMLEEERAARLLDRSARLLVTVIHEGYGEEVARGGSAPLLEFSQRGSEAMKGRSWRR